MLDRLIDLVYKGWYGGFWNLLGFGMQMVLIVVTGTMFANTEPVHKIIVKIASVPKTPKQALILVSAVGMVAYFLQWGAALIVCAVLAQEVAKKVKGIHYPLLVAAAYVGNAFCLVGISRHHRLKCSRVAGILKAYGVQQVFLSGKRYLHLIICLSMWLVPLFYAC